MGLWSAARLYRRRLLEISTTRREAEYASDRYETPNDFPLLNGEKRPASLTATFPIWNSQITRARGKESLRMSRSSVVIFYLLLPALFVSVAEPAEARGGSNPDCHVPSIRLCPGCTVSVKITVLQNRECRINYSSLGAMHGQRILVGPRHGKYWANNETSTAYSPDKDFLGSDYFETRFSYELMNGSSASAVLKATVEVAPHR
jgi:hypothetical protein